MTFDVQEDQERFQGLSRLQLCNEFLSRNSSEQAKIGIRQEDLEELTENYYTVDPNHRIVRHAKYKSFARLRAFIYVDEKILEDMLSLEQFGNKPPSGYVEVVNANGIYVRVMVDVLYPSFYEQMLDPNN
jgi:hypothetical protein